MAERTRQERFMLMDHDTTRSFIDDDEFHWDALLRCNGDFENDGEKLRYMQAIVDILNKHADEIPTRPEGARFALENDQD